MEHDLWKFRNGLISIARKIGMTMDADEECKAKGGRETCKYHKNRAVNVASEATKLSQKHGRIKTLTSKPKGNYSYLSDDQKKTISNVVAKLRSGKAMLELEGGILKHVAGSDDNAKAQNRKLIGHSKTSEFRVKHPERIANEVIGRISTERSSFRVARDGTCKITVDMGRDIGVEYSADGTEIATSFVTLTVKKSKNGPYKYHYYPGKSGG